jgi:alkylated DNA nucleotide flippase Atl1
MTQEGSDPLTVDQQFRVIKLLDGEEPLIGYGELATYTSVGEVTNLTPQEVGIACAMIAENSAAKGLPLYRIVRGNGYVSNKVPEDYLDQLRAEGHTLVKTKTGEWKIADFADCLA